MAFTLTAEQQRWVDIASSLAPDIAKASRRDDEAAAFPTETFALLREAGILNLAVPRQFGGEGPATGNAHLTAYLVTEQVSRACAATGWDLIIHYHQCGAVARLGNDEQKRRILGDVVTRGAIMGSLGSEVNHQEQTAAKDATRKLIFQAEMAPVKGGFLANAAKHFCSNAPVADYMLYWSIAPGANAATDGLTLSIVTKDSPGLTFSRHGWDDIIGLRSSVSWSAKLDNVFIPWDNVLGEPGDFVQKDPYTLELSQAFHLLGAAQGALDYVLEVLRARPFLQNEEGLMVTLGELSGEVQASRGSCLIANSLWEQERFGDAALASLRAHHTARETAIHVITKVFDMVGTRALFKTAPLERLWRDVRTASLHTRASQLLRLVADADVAGHYAPKQKYGALVDKPKTWADLGIAREPSSAVA
ncbi:acyl-CoA dehydrogenase family protein [Chelatococcus asaccharovorans]|uniref:acyl-CoA dehydrogenase family protein n=1 Tax=Chelatococcus asaccharovorans TaxID=28210 RepID=UPI00224C6572|nr:acyl-CoA dehydrogenase family protein [Chelatococcus asaccharovorans]CAH1649093.1 Butyryl-CoA dehydrogenase [Chelatococcus asaccharovorans]CAH1691320.1 Butyryl-CoA dehydrogenase [Chelatococcus asaccharovorans]